MDYFNDIYSKRVNRFGYNHSERLLNKRKLAFEDFLSKTPHFIDFTVDSIPYTGAMTRMRQGDSRTLMYLLTRTELELSSGTIFFVEEKDKDDKPWMIYYLEDIVASGYNRYIVLKMTHYLTWNDSSGTKRNAWAYFYGQEDNMLMSEIRSRSRSDAIYLENLKMSFFITPTNPYIKKDDYFIVGESGLEEYYRVVGYDRNSQPGVEYVTVDPTYRYDMTPKPEQQQGEPDEDFYWLNQEEGSKWL